MLKNKLLYALFEINSKQGSMPTLQVTSSLLLPEEDNGK